MDVSDLVQNLKSASQLIRQVLQDIIDDPVLSLVQNSPGWKERDLAKQLLQEDWDISPWDSCGSRVVDTVCKAIVQGLEQKFSCSGKLKMLSSITKSSIELKATFCDAIRQTDLVLDEKTANHLLQHMIDLLVPLISSELSRMKKLSGHDDEETTVQTDMTAAEKQVLHYVIGYTVKKLRAKFHRCSVNNKAAQIYLDIMKTWTVDPEESTLSSSVQGRTKALDRGGLLHCSAQFYHFMKAVELNVRLHLNAHMLLHSMLVKMWFPLLWKRLKATKGCKKHF